MTLLKEMLFVLDLAQRAGSPDDMRAADRLQRRCVDVCRTEFSYLYFSATISVDASTSGC